ncbi:hypothetical protein PMAYCL1PPCAC_09524 [Pristionchus mayeri]|uniref:DNA2/NAM7 helicase-like C-terminal domain-containing protein n=1 Tax=Pristionchus mayeri TaxID=1317129 RepID=A0AAN4ZH48_9BILA|nr:hypothetical protein PMAYCL1PPCAC_09524 [Pristionchus mayeri]
MPHHPGFIGQARFLTESGALIDVIVESVVKSDRAMQLFCRPDQELPRGLRKNSKMECVSVKYRTPMVTAVLESFAKKSRPIVDRELINRIYGQEGTYVHQKVNDNLVRIHSKDGRTGLLAPDHSATVNNYLDEGCPGLVLECSSLTSKALAIASMCGSYCAPRGLQLVLSPDPDSLRDISLAIHSLDTGNKRIINIAELEPGASHFSLFDSTTLDKKQLKHLTRLSSRLTRASGRSARKLHRLQRRAHAAAIAALGDQDVLMMTTEQAFYWLLRPKDPLRPCHIQELLEQKVARVIINDSQEVSEAELNCLVLLLSCPGTKIVSVSDNENYAELHEHNQARGGCSALELTKLKQNLPVLKIRSTEVCWEEEEPALDLGAVFDNAGERAEWEREEWTEECNRIFVSVRDSKAIPSGKSIINDGEVSALVWIVNRLRAAGYDQHQVLIAAFYEAQMELATTRLPVEYEVIMVEEVEDSSSKIVRVMTTADSSSNFEEMDCEKRCNIALSAHTDALIVLGCDDQGTASGWSNLLGRGYFNQVK